MRAFLRASGAIVATYVISWHVVLLTLFVSGILRGGSGADEVWNAYVHDLPSIVLAERDELTDWVRWLALAVTACCVVGFLVVRVNRRRVATTQQGVSKP
jgi:hypothetical protein